MVYAHPFIDIKATQVSSDIPIPGSGIFTTASTESAQFYPHIHITVSLELSNTDRIRVGIFVV